MASYLSLALACSLCPASPALAQDLDADLSTQGTEELASLPEEAQTGPSADDSSDANDQAQDGQTPDVQEPGELLAPEAPAIDATDSLDDAELTSDDEQSVGKDQPLDIEEQVTGDDIDEEQPESDSIVEEGEEPATSQPAEAQAGKTSLQTQASATVIHKGFCGDTDNGADGKNVQWKLYSDGKLELSGKGVTGFYSHDESFSWFGNPNWPDWHDYADSITSVSIGEGITELNGGVLANLPNITSVTLPSSMRELDQCVFFNCGSLQSVKLNKGLQTIGVSVFEGTQVTQLSVPPTVSSIGYNNFSQIPLRGLAIEGPNPLLSIKDDVVFGDGGQTLIFYSRDKQGAYAVPASVKKIGACAFESCYGLTSVTLPNGLTHIEEGAFHLSGLSAPIVIPDSVKYIGRQAFSGLDSPISSIHVGSGVTDPSWSVFCYSDGIQSIHLAEGPKYLGEDALEDCTSLTSIAFPNSYLRLDDGICSGCTSLASVRIGSKVKTIGREAFLDCTSLRNISIPKGVTSIGERAFYNTAITKVVLPSTVTSVGANAFPKGCKVTYGQALVPTDTGSYELPGKVTALKYSVTYKQTSARSMLKSVNAFRTGNEAWWYTGEVGGKKQKEPGLQKLTYDYDLERAAMIRAREIALLFSHTRPCGLDCDTAVNVSLSAYGENIAAGQASVASVMESWKETDYGYAGQGHRRNMLDSNFNAIGIGHVVFEGVHYWVQEFGYIESPNTKATAAKDKKVTATTTVYNKAIRSVAKKKVSASTLLIKKAKKSVALPTVSATGIVLAQEYDTTWGSFDAKAKVIWTSDKPSIAKIVGNKVVGVRKGTTYIRAKAFGKTFKVRICVGIKGNVKNLKVKIKNKKYTGKAIKPSPVLKLNGVKLKKNVDYKLTYKKNKKRGKATMVITGIGHYVGTKTVTFKIV